MIRHRSTRNRFVLSAYIALFLLVSAYVALAAISLSTSATYEQNFDGMGIPATATTASNLPGDFRVDALSTSTAQVRAVGTFSAALATAARAGGASLSSSAANGVYNFGAGTAALGGSDRAVGFLSSGTATFSGNLYAQLVNNTGSSFSGLQISYNVEKYRMGSNAAGFRIQLFYSTDGNSWTNAGSSFLTSFAADANNNGFATAPGATVAVSNTLSASIANGSSFYLAWNYSVSSGTTTTNAQALAIDDVAILGIAGSSPTNPAGTGAANPNTVQAGNATLLTVAVTPGTNPASTGIGVTADLTSIGGPAAQAFHDDGLNGDAAAGDNIFSFQATVSAATAAGGKTIPATITDAQARSGSASIALTVTAASPTPTGAGSANPSSLQAGNATLLTVAVTPGSNPVSTGIGVVGDLSQIGGSATQPFLDDGLNGDATAGDNVFSFQATVTAGTSTGAKSLPITISDAQSRNSSTSISLTVQPPPPPTAVKISQVYGGGGNSGSTYMYDFIEIFNQSASPVDLTGWSVQYNSATATGPWQVTSLCPASCMLLPGHYFLVQGAAGAGGTTALPPADAPGTINLSSSSGKVALVASAAALSGGCPSGGSIVDLVAYGATSCSVSAATLSNTTAAVRKGNGCVNTGSSANDFVAIGPIPRDTAAPANSCGGDPAQPSGLGIATAGSIEASGTTLLTVSITPATAPPSTGLTVTADLTSIGGPASQPFYDDGTHGDTAAGNNVFSFRATIGAAIPTGVKYMIASVTDAQSRTVNVPITLTVESPTCGVERWSVKTGTDPEAGLVNLNSPAVSTIDALRGLTAPADPPLNSRVQPAETTVYSLNGTLTLYKKESDVDYHVVVQDNAGRTMILEIPSPGCVGAGSPFAAGVALARAKFDARLTALPEFQTANIPVQAKGVGFFDFIHGQTGVAPNGIELHPLLDISFPADVTAQFTVTTSGFTYSPVTKLYSESVKIVNNGAATAGPVNVLFTNLTSTVTMSNPSGSFGGDPYMIAPNTTGGMTTGQAVTFTARFSNPNNVQIQATTRLYAGQLN